jgi:hypothetical protein
MVPHVELKRFHSQLSAIRRARDATRPPEAPFFGPQKGVFKAGKRGKGTKKSKNANLAARPESTAGTRLVQRMGVASRANRFWGPKLAKSCFFFGVVKTGFLACQAVFCLVDGRFFRAVVAAFRGQKSALHGNKSSFPPIKSTFRRKQVEFRG